MGGFERSGDIGNLVGPRWTSSDHHAIFVIITETIPFQRGRENVHFLQLKRKRAFVSQAKTIIPESEKQTGRNSFEFTVKIFIACSVLIASLFFCIFGRHFVLA